MVSGGGQFGSIITVGVCPCWDVTCYVAGADWGEHAELSGQRIEPAGKALNVSKALGWMGRPNTAAGLWGEGDYQQFQDEMKSLNEFVQERMTVVAGKTRRNVTVVDTAGGREMHLRAKSGLATREGLVRLKEDLRGMVQEGSVCVFSGAMPGGVLLGDCLDVLGVCRSAGGRVVVDSSGEALRGAVDAGGLWIIKPNVAELCELLGKEVTDEAEAIAEAASGILDKVETVVVSRGERGAIAVSGEAAVEGSAENDIGVSSTVGCGDYLLAGFLDGLMSSCNISFALERGLKASAAKAYGWAGERSFAEAEEGIKVRVSQVR